MISLQRQRVFQPDKVVGLIVSHGYIDQVPFCFYIAVRVESFVRRCEYYHLILFT